MSAILKVDAAMVSKYTGLPSSTPALPGHEGVIPVPLGVAELPEELKVNQSIELEFGPFKIERYSVIFAPNPELYEFCSVSAPTYLMPGFKGTVLMRIRAAKTFAPKLFLEAHPFATVHVLD